MQRILVLNSKGGCGKTTLASNLASYYAGKGCVTVLLDYDSQASSMRWLSLRDAERPAIHGIAAYQRRRDVTRAFQMRLPVEAERVIMDVPAGVTGLALVEYVQRVDTILVPVLPSPIDIHAAAHFIQDLLLIGKIRSAGVRLAVVANRVRENTLIFKDLERFLATLKLPLVATLRDSQNYIRAAEQGLGVHELEKTRTAADQERWAPLVAWLDVVDPLPSNNATSAQLANVVPIGVSGQ
ncbi:MAG: AAA family ATPase [Ectothiorhodospiraceae bacterium]|nr:AAA family ATPase [Ectothiorhodospiraceae bacterium]